MKIGSLEIENPVILAPLAGITDLPFRLLARASGCSLVYSEMISANGLVYRSRKTEAMLSSSPAEKPVAFQIFGADPDVMARAAAKVEAAGADVLDINFGCSVKKVLKTGAGAALMRDPDRAGQVLRTVRAAVSVPLTIKMRSGWDLSGTDALRLAEIAENCGVDAVSLHPRTAMQGFSGRADWNLITRLKQQTVLPVIGNGDITSPEDALRMLAETGCDAVMIGRAAITAPWILQQTCFLWAGRPVPGVSMAGRFAFMRQYVADTLAHYGESHGCRIMRSRLGWFSKGLPHSARFRETITRIAARKEAEQCLADYEALLAKEEKEQGCEGS